MTEDIDQLRTELLNVMAEAGRLALKFDPLSAAALAPIPSTDPQQYVVAGTLPMIAKVLPAESSTDWRPYHSALSRCAELLDNMKDGDPITEVPDFLAAYLASLSQATLEDSEQYRQQMAGISCASFGYWKEGDSIHPDYDTVPLRDVAKLYAKYEALYESQATRAEVEYELVQDDMVVAGTNGPGAWREILHYAAQYEQDGPVEIIEVARRKVTAPTAQEVIQQAVPTDDLLDVFDPARSKLKREDWDAATRKPKVATQQAAKAETAEQAEGDQANVLPPTRGTGSQHEAIIGAIGRGYCTHTNSHKAVDFELVHAMADEVEKELARRCCAQREDKPNGSDLAPTTSTVSAPEEVRNQAADTDFAALMNDYRYCRQDHAGIAYSFVKAHVDQNKAQAVNAALEQAARRVEADCIGFAHDDKQLNAIARDIRALRTTSGKGDAA